MADAGGGYVERYLSRPIDVSQYGVIFAGAQKNMGCAGLTVVIIREDLIGHASATTPTMLDYAPMAEKGSITWPRRRPA